MPSDLGEVLARYRKVIVPELNSGQLCNILRAKYLVDAQGYNKVKGRPFAVQELVTEIRRQLGLSTNGQPRETAAVAELAKSGTR